MTERRLVLKITELAGNYKNSLKTEFKGYNAKSFSKDLLAGITVAAVALPLALAFGVSSGASAAAGLITAIMAGIVIGVLSGGSYQISGPTGAMTAILVSLVASYGLDGMFLACFISGIILLLCGLFKVGGLVSFIPLPVITGFTSGIAIIIAFGQVNNLTGLKSEGDNTIEQFTSYFKLSQSLDTTSLIIGLCVIAFMFLYPKKLNAICPSSLTAIILAVIVKIVLDLDVKSVGEIPKTLFLDSRLGFNSISPSAIKNVLAPAFSIAALGLIESLLCGACAGRMKNEKLDADRELISQGLGNMVIPFFGGVPATAAIARTSVAVKAGGKTRLTGVFHSLVLLLSMFLLGPVMSKIPLSALAGVLIVTAIRMNEWSVIKDIFHKKIKTAIFQFLITMVATVVFDLTIAILIGLAFSVIMFVVKVSDMQVVVSDVEQQRITGNGINPDKLENVCVAYITGPLYFGTCNKLEEKLVPTDDSYSVILSMRGVPFADISGINALHELCEKLVSQGIMVYFTCVQPPVMDMLERAGLKERYKYDMFFWDTNKAFEHISAL